MSTAAAPATIPLADVQGLILRSYGMDALRVFALRVDHPSEARIALGKLPLTNGAPWEQKPDFCVNLALTFSGLKTLGLPESSLSTFPEEFRLGAAQRG